MSVFLRLTMLVATLVSAAPAEAKSVFLNNVQIDGLTNQKFENCTVEIDAQGNVFITAKGYRVENMAPTPAPAAALSKRYWLVSENKSPGMDQYDLELLINGVSVRKVTTKDEQFYLEVTKYLKKGPNQIFVIAKKNMEGGQRKSTSPQHQVRLMIGEGSMTDRTIMIDKQLLDYRRTAAEVDNFTEQFALEAR